MIVTVTQWQVNDHEWWQLHNEWQLHKVAVTQSGSYTYLALLDVNHSAREESLLHDAAVVAEDQHGVAHLEQQQHGFTSEAIHGSILRPN